MQPNSKSINLEANILNEWYVSDVRLRRQLTIRLNLLIVVGLVAVTLLPVEFSWMRRVDGQAAFVHKRVVVDSARKQSSDALVSAAMPAEQQFAMDEATRASFQTLLGNIVLLMNATPTSVAMENLHVEAMDSSLTIRCQCAAETFQAGQDFVKAASNGPNVTYAVQSSTLKSSELKPDGIAFDFVKKVNLEP